MSARAAVFLDRDGTIIEDIGYIADPDAVRLLPGAARPSAGSIAPASAAIVVTNQSGIARGLLDESAYQARSAPPRDAARGRGARLDARLPLPPSSRLHRHVRVPQARSPALSACRRRRSGSTWPASWWVGDRLRDVLPAAAFGGRGIVLDPAERARRSCPRPTCAEAVTEGAGLAMSRVCRCPVEPPRHYFLPP